MKQLLKEGNKKINTMNNKNPNWFGRVWFQVTYYETVGS